MKRIAVVMDWYGVIGDREETSKRYREVYASLLRSRYGGSYGRWLKAHDLAFEWYITEWQRLYERHHNGAEFEKELEARTVKKAFQEAGLQIENGEAFRLATDLEFEIASQLGCLYPDVLPSLGEMGDMDVDLYVASNVSAEHLKGLLKSAGLTGVFLGMLTPDQVGSRKSRQAFWKKTYRELGITPSRCLVVDDSHLNLVGAQKSGAVTVCVQRRKPQKKAAGMNFKPDYTIKSLKELPQIIKKVLG